MDEKRPKKQWEINKGKYNIQYKKDNMKRVPLDMQKTEYDEMKAHADSRGETVNGFIKRSIKETIERDTDADQSEPS